MVVFQNRTEINGMKEWTGGEFHFFFGILFHVFCQW